ncbi:FkbM family methyltransferase [Halioxenophilus aromaticivorans]|uniref:Methyltransferase FkbM domain-containing protein n=1 Tax=Halioxenophilus aromaticivorans TaxID=1306992 RepID=A0AAV3TZU1_9ALTE
MIDTEVYAFGYNEHTQALIKHVKVIGIIDEYTDKAEIDSIPVISLEQLAPGITIVNCVYNSRAFSAQARLETLGGKVLFVGDFIRDDPEAFKGTMLAEAFLAMQEDYSLLKQWQHQFHDEASRQQYLSVLDFRRTLNVRHLSCFEVKIDAQYFEPFVVNRPYLHLIDGGAYDGADSLRFAECFPNYKSITILEPSTANRVLIADKTKALKHSTVLGACLGDRETTVHFEGEGTAAKMVSSGGAATAMRTIDTLVKQESTLVKLDIEGAEMQALVGAAKTLHRVDAGFAISAYHLPHDLMHILDWLKMSEVKRQFFFRHYSNGIAESVVFAL